MTRPDTLGHANADCRFCGTPLRHVFADLGATPLANAYLTADQLTRPEPSYPLRAYVCEQCFLVQLEAMVPPEDIFGDYAYFSSFSSTLLRHSEQFADAITERLGLGPADRVVEVASNDGYLLQYFARKGLQVQGIEPAANIASAAEARGIPTRVQFFGAEVARQLADEAPRPRLIVANNVIAHVPALNDFVEGLEILLAPGGTVSLECHSLLALIEDGQFDNIYHEHLQYFSLTSLATVLEAHGLEVVDVEHLSTQGGSLRVLAQRRHEAGTPSPRVAAMRALEAEAGLCRLEGYGAFAVKMAAARRRLVAFLDGARDAGQAVVCYGAAAKGNTLLNVCEVTADMVDYCVDRNPRKQGHFLPGSRIPIHPPERVTETKPAFLLILPWNLSAEIVDQMAIIRTWGGVFVVPLPLLNLFG
ncbi:MAG: class I SAM-dependent methyltransferase [Vicinamibacterales bacterium]